MSDMREAVFGPWAALDEVEELGGAGEVGGVVDAHPACRTVFSSDAVATP